MWLCAQKEISINGDEICMKFHIDIIIQILRIIVLIIRKGYFLKYFLHLTKYVKILVSNEKNYKSSIS